MNRRRETGIAVRVRTAPSAGTEIGSIPSASAACPSIPPRRTAADVLFRMRGLATVLTACAVALFSIGGLNAASEDFVAVKGTQFVIADQPYRFVGVNLWYGAYLGASASYGDRERLVAELDALKALGIDNLRVLGGSEKSPFKRSLRETFRDGTAAYNEDLLQGLDFLLAEMRKREMRAVIYLNNFWEWSGGMGTYLYWTNGGTFVDLGDPAHPWPEFQNATAKFYENAAAKASYRDYVRAVLSRVNTVTGVRYSDDPTIMAWQLANEPRPSAEAAEGSAELQAFYKWIEETAAFIKSLDANHLVSSGNEGFMGCNEIESCFSNAHRAPSLDYLTFHLWPRNWGWIDPGRPEQTFEEAVDRAADYVAAHVEMARSLGKPVVLEEFGLDRDGEALTPGSPATYRDALMKSIYSFVETDAGAGGPLAGTNVWSWGGVGRAEHADFEWRAGDTAFTGDPPQEPQGRNSIFDADSSTLAVMRAHAQRLKQMTDSRRDKTGVD